jgi:hypothetical protein
MRPNSGYCSYYVVDFADASDFKAHMRALLSEWLADGNPQPQASSV